MKTYHYRIKDSNTHKQLQKLSMAVNFVWNFCNETQQTALKRSSARLIQKNGQVVPIPNFFSAFEFNKLVGGSSKELGLHAQTIQAVAEKYSDSRKTAKKRWLRFRGKKNLGWVPFKASNIKLDGDVVTYRGRKFRLWLDRELQGKIKCGSFSEDTRGRWYVSITTDHTPELKPAPDNPVGIDLGLKTFATCSDGKKFAAARYYRKYERLLKLAQKNKKRRRIKAISAKIKNSRKDLAHKVSHELARDHNLIVIGDVSSSKLVKTKMAKSVNDAGWSMFKLFLRYKAIARQGRVIEVSEYLTSQTCSSCETRSPPGAPKGVKGLGIREWVCGVCSTILDRDVNAAMNILRLGHQSLESEGI